MSAATAHPPMLLTPLTPLIGREREVATVVDLVQRGGARLVSLTGPGGPGEPPLALQVAAELTGAFDGQVWFVALAAERDSALVPAAIAQTLRVRERADQLLLATLSSF